ncbi:hypothetical protein WCLP8_1000002 [uncultured Gammaproteobacteria bacterium]
MVICERIVTTSHGDLAVLDSDGTGHAVLFIHGNSFSKDVFRALFSSDLVMNYRLIAIDLPGHGHSSNAADPDRVYTLPGYAESLRQALEALSVTRVVIVGWSLGGHIAIEALARWLNVAGVMIIGAPPASPTMEALGAAFHAGEVLNLANCEVWSETGIDTYIKALCGTDQALTKILRTAIQRADGRSRALLLPSYLAGQGADQRLVVSASYQRA